MFKPFLTALVYEILSFLKGYPTFFAMSEENRMTHLKESSIPAAFKSYLGQVSEKEFMADLYSAVGFAGGARNNFAPKGNGFFRAMVSFFTGPVAAMLDTLGNAFYTASQSTREEAVLALRKKGRIGAAIAETLLRFTYQELGAGISTLAKRVADAPYILVQSPREVDGELKAEIRKHLLKKHPLSFPIFQINQQLIGGLRIFTNGEIIDHSWISRILRFTSLTTA